MYCTLVNVTERNYLETCSLVNVTAIAILQITITPCTCPQSQVLFGNGNGKWKIWSFSCINSLPPSFKLTCNAQRPSFLPAQHSSCVGVSVYPHIMRQKISARSWCSQKFRWYTVLTRFSPLSVHSFLALAMLIAVLKLRRFANDKFCSSSSLDTTQVIYHTRVIYALRAPPPS